MAEPTFEDGIIWAVARIVELHDEPVVAADVLRESGIDVRRRKIGEADRPYIREVLKEPYFRLRKGQPNG